MALIRWEPTRELQTIQSEVNRLFDSFFGAAAPAESVAARRYLPAMDLLEGGEDYVLRVDLPGMRQEDVRIELEQGLLSISGERKAEHEERKEGAHRLERSYGAFTRTLTLPEGVDPERIRASLKEGVLEVRIAKPEQRQPRRIEITPADEGAARDESAGAAAAPEQPAAAALAA